MSKEDIEKLNKQIDMLNNSIPDKEKEKEKESMELPKTIIDENDKDHVIYIDALNSNKEDTTKKVKNISDIEKDEINNKESDFVNDSLDKNLEKKLANIDKENEEDKEDNLILILLGLLVFIIILLLLIIII